MLVLSNGVYIVYRIVADTYTRYVDRLYKTFWTQFSMLLFAEQI